VVIAGGGVIGSSCAYHLKHELDFPGSVLVVEPDPGYRAAASARSASSIRLQFSTAINIELSAFGMQFLRDAPRRFERCGAGAGVSLVESTYLYLATPAGRATLACRAALQREMSVPVTWHEAAALHERYPWLNTQDLAAGCDTTSGEGWFDGYGLLCALRAGAEAAGARYVKDRVIGLERCEDGRIAAVRLGERGRICCQQALIAAGTRSRHLAAAAGIDLPVFPRKRQVFVFSCQTPLRCPLVIDPSGLWFRSEHDRFLCGPPADPDPDVEPDDFEVDPALFETTAWPLLAHRVPAFEAIRMTSAWAGHYDYNTFDQNAFVGPIPGIPNLLVAAGFSGHGIQQAPAIGRGLAEYLSFGGYRSIDLAPLSYARYLAGAPLQELNVI